MDPSPVGAAPGPAAPMGGRGAAAAHVALPRWRLLRTELPGRLRGWGRRAAAEGGGRGPAELASPPLPSSPCRVGGAFRAAAGLHHAAGLEPRRRRSGVIMLAEVRAPLRSVGCGGVGAALRPAERSDLRPSPAGGGSALSRGLRAALVSGSPPRSRARGSAGPLLSP